ncbi:Hsp70 family protein [Treponema zioleckii]|uniref:Hsp70 family protein n=1 Tax=Treponema zioleckii TaxID=331680 RepID=UPI00168AF125|nr:Hsp70 family protein [Treponema zioleckii]
MKTIGIKLADGTFYPILEEGTPKVRMLDLTTAKDNQSKVQIDLYRSEDGTMENAEYVDTLEVTSLNPHPNGEPELHLKMGLDENNELTAEVVDPETGKKSETKVELISRTLAERDAPTDFAVSGSSDVDLPDSDDATVAENAGDVDVAPENSDDEFSFDEITDEDFANLDTPSEQTAVPEITDELNLDSIPDSTADDSKTEVADLANDKFSFDNAEVVNENGPDPADAIVADESALPSFEELNKELDAEETVAESDDIPADDTTVNDDFADNKFDADGLDVPAESSFVDPLNESEAVKSVDLENPFEETVEDEKPGETSNEDLFDTSALDAPSFDDFGSDNTESADDKSADISEETLPDFGDFSIPEDDNNAEKNAVSGGASATGLSGLLTKDDLDDPIFKNTDSDPVSEFDTSALDNDSFDSTDFGTDFNDFDSTKTDSGIAAAGSSMDFSDLYDKETLNGEHADIYADHEETKKKTRVPVIICVVCAIICVIATILVLFVIPSKYNLIKSRNTRYRDETNVTNVTNVKSEPKAEKTSEELPPPPPAPVSEPLNAEPAPVPEASTEINLLPPAEETQTPASETQSVGAQEKGDSGEAEKTSASEPAANGISEQKSSEPSEPEPVAEKPAKSAPVAVEDKIVITTEPENVVPVPQPVPANPEKDAVPYRIKWGDTLWDISDSFYKNPWKYPKIADYNSIPNPDIIISGTDILIPNE